MKLSDKEQWLLATGVWFGIGASIISYSLSVIIMPNEPLPKISGLIVGVIFISISIYSQKMFNKTQS